MLFANKGVSREIRFNSSEGEWERKSLVSDAWVPCSVPGYFEWDDVVDYYHNKGIAVRYSTGNHMAVGGTYVR
jgi:hypothetical protein